MTGTLDLTQDHVARATRIVPDDLFTSTYTPATETQFQQIAAKIAAERPQGPLLIFGYGSLIWNPGFDFVAIHEATAHGWHRQFCMEMRVFRGTPDAPGLMMAIQRGGRCKGVAFEIAETEADRTIRALVEREMPFVETFGEYRWLTLETDLGPRGALVFWAGPKGDTIARDLTPQETALRIARACGPRGSNAEYLRNTVISLAEQGINDRNLWQLQHLVAAEIDRLFPDRT